MQSANLRVVKRKRDSSLRGMFSFVRIRCFFCLTVIFSLLAGCGSPQNRSKEQDQGEQLTADGRILIGESATVKPPENGFSLIDQETTLAADGLYYLSWGAGEPTDYQNSDGETVDLYEASLYVLMSENKSVQKAESSAAAWLAAAKENYSIDSEESLTVHDISYTILRYHCSSQNNPYDKGVSAFASNDTTAFCAELTCLKDYDKDLDTILLDFLDSLRFRPPEET